MNPMRKFRTIYGLDYRMTKKQKQIENIYTKKKRKNQDKYENER